MEAKTRMLWNIMNGDTLIYSFFGTANTGNEKYQDWLATHPGRTHQLVIYDSSKDYPRMTKTYSYSEITTFLQAYEAEVKKKAANLMKRYRK